MIFMRCFINEMTKSQTAMSYFTLIVFALGVTIAPMTSTALSIEYEYSPTGRLLHSTYEGDDRITYEYDTVGNRTLFRYDSGTIVSVPDYLALADFDGNEVVDCNDLALLRAGYRKEQGSDCYSTSFDLTSDGIADAEDVLTWYSICSDSRWLPGDWTGQEWIEHSDFTTIASDHTVDFWDLLVLAQFWGEDVSGLPSCEFLDLERGDRPGIIDENDLMSFSASWSEAREPIPARCIDDGEVLTPTYEIPSGDCSISVQVSALESSDLNSTYIDIMLSGAAPELNCFQFTLDASISLTETLGDEDDNRTMILGSPDDTEQAVCFQDRRDIDSGWMITGALLDTEPRRMDDAIVLCSIKIPKYLGTREFRVSDVRYATIDGAVIATASWSGQIASEAVPENTCLVGNYPNPFNPATNIEFGLAHASHVKLCIYDLSGRLVRTLLDDNLPTGWYEQIWMGRDDRGVPVSSGVYFLRMSGDGESLNHKLILVH